MSDLQTDFTHSSKTLFYNGRAIAKVGAAEIRHLNYIKENNQENTNMLKTINLKSAVVALALGGLIAAPASSKAGTETKATDGKASKNVVEQTKQPCVTGDLGVNFVSEYISRGLVYENQGAIAQPYTDVYFKLYQGEGAINTVQFQLGVWSSLQGHVSNYYPFVQTAISKYSGVRDWFEFDYTGALSVTFLKNYTATFSYIEADYPSSVYVNPNRNLQLGIAMNDSDYLGVFALHPHFNVLYELVTNSASYIGNTEITGPGAAGINPGGWYYEIGIAPNYTFLPKSSYPITVTVPATLGLGDQSGFYAHNVFGYFTTGLNVSVPLAFIPTCFGAWTTNAGFNYYYLGNTAALASGSKSGNPAPGVNQPQGMGVTGGQSSQWVFSGGVGMTF